MRVREKRPRPDLSPPLLSFTLHCQCQRHGRGCEVTRHSVTTRSRQLPPPAAPHTGDAPPSLEPQSAEDGRPGCCRYWRARPAGCARGRRGGQRAAGDDRGPAAGAQGGARASPGADGAVVGCEPCRRLPAGRARAGILRHPLPAPGDAQRLFAGALFRPRRRVPHDAGHPAGAASCVTRGRSAPKCGTPRARRACLRARRSHGGRAL